MQHETDSSHTSISSCFLYSSATILYKIPGQLKPTHLSSTSLPKLLCSFCHILHLKSASQKGPAAKLRYRALKRLTQLCWRQLEENIWHRPQDKIFSLYTLFIHNHLCMLRFGDALASSFLKSPLSIAVLQECLLLSWLVYQKAHEVVSIT